MNWLLVQKPQSKPWNYETLRQLKCLQNKFMPFRLTWKYPPCWYIQGVLMHTSVLDQLWGGNEILKWVLVYEYVTWLCLAWSPNVLRLASSRLMDTKQGYEGDEECIFFTLNIYWAIFVSGILWYKCRNWS